MKQFFAACALMLGIVSMSVAQEVVTGPAISLDKDVHDYGTIQQGANGACEFTVTNSGKSPHHFSLQRFLRMHCSSVREVAHRSRQHVCDHGEVRHQAHRPNQKSVTITSNASNEPTKVIRIKGKVEASDLGNSGGVPVKQPAAGAPTTGKQ